MGTSMRKANESSQGVHSSRWARNLDPIDHRLIHVALVHRVAITYESYNSVYTQPRSGG